MPRGFAGVREAANTIDQRKNAGQGGSGTFYFSLKRTGDSAVVRFLEQGEDIHWCWAHEVPSPKRQWGDWVPCIDQKNQGDNCPGCVADLTRRFKGFINVIWRGAPVYQRDENGRPTRDTANNLILIDNQDQVALWNQGIQVFEDLDDKDATYKGLGSRDFRITRKGEGKNTRYAIDPSDPDGGPQPLSDNDVKLAEEKFDLNQFVLPPSNDDFALLIQQRTGGGTNTGSGARAAASGSPNPFLNER